MELISRERLCEKLQKGDATTLVMTMGESAYRAAHIPGSIHFANIDGALQMLKPKEEIVVYCSGPSCMASATAYWLLKGQGYENVRRYAGGLEDWAEVGCPLAGEQTELFTRNRPLLTLASGD